MKNVILVGAMGNMGQTIAEEIARDRDLTLAGAVESPGHEDLGSRVQGVEVTDSLGEVIPDGDIAVDFTVPENAIRTIRTCSEKGIAVVVGTTGLNREQLFEAEKAADRIPLLVSPNMSLGVNLLFSLVEEITTALPGFDIEVAEIHHNRKKDSPSGTAARIGEIIKQARENARIVHGREGEAGPRDSAEVGMHSLRGGDVTGEHTVIFAGEGERLELVHRAHSRRTFARGTVRAIHFMLEKEPGFYTMNDVLKL